MLRLLLVGDLDPYLTTGARFAAFRALGVDVEGVDTRPFVAGQGACARRLTHFTLPDLIAAGQRG